MSNSLINLTLPNYRRQDDPGRPGRQLPAPGFYESEFRTDLVGNSDCNKYIPVIGLLNHEMLIFEDLPDVKVLEYSIPIAHSQYGNIRQYAHLVDNFIRGTVVQKYVFKLQGVEHYLYVHRGIVYDGDKNVLICLAMDVDYVMNTSIEQMRANLDLGKTVLFISRNLDNPIYKNVKKKFQELWIDRATAAGIDVVYTGRINDWLFKNNFTPPTFRTVAQRMRHLKDEVPTNLLMD